MTWMLHELCHRKMRRNINELATYLFKEMNIFQNPNRTVQKSLLVFKDNLVSHLA